MTGASEIRLATGMVAGTDAANAHVLTQGGFANQARYVPQEGWYAYDAKLGAWLRDRHLVKLEQVAATILREAVGRHLAWARTQPRDREQLKVAERWAHSVGNRKTLINAINHAAGQTAYLMDASEFDRDYWLLNCRNGVLDLHTGKVLDHCPEQFLTLQTGVEFSLGATHPQVDRLISLLEASGVRDFLHRFLGSILWGRQVDEIMVVLKGEGATGKTTLTALLQQVLGTYACAIDVNLILKKRWADSGTGPKPEYLTLKGRRLVVASEPPENSELDEARVKAWTGGDAIAARGMRSDEVVNFTPQFKLLLNTNHTVHFRSDDSGMIRRYRLVDFAPKLGKKDLLFKPALIDDPAAHSAFLTWMYQGFRLWYDEDFSLGDTATVMVTTAKSLDAFNPYSQFAQERLHFGPQATISVTRLTELFGQWWLETGSTSPVPHPDGLRRHLESKGCARKRTAQTRLWSGVTERDADEAGPVTE